MAKVKEFLDNSIVWILICVAVLALAVIGLFVNFFTLSVTAGGVTEKISFTLSGAASSDTYSVSDWSALSNIGLTQAVAYCTVALAAVALVLQVICLFVKKDSLDQLLYILSVVACFALLTLGIVTLFSAGGLFGGNVNDLLLDANGVAVSSTTVSASIGMSAGPVLIGLPSILGGLYGLAYASNKIYNK